MTYQLTNINDIINNDNNNYKIIKWNKQGNEYFIIKYNKKYITDSNINLYGLYRSVIFKNNKVLSFSPPKSVNLDYFKHYYLSNNTNDNTNDNIVAEEFIEGTMINLFYDNDINEWIISTKSTIDANIKFFINDYKNNKTFKDMFYEIIQTTNIDYDKLPKNYCYSFIIQHKDNRIVTPFSENKLYVISVYNINNNNYIINEISKHEMMDIFKDTKVSFPIKYKFTNFFDIENMATINKPYNFMGIILKFNNLRTKIRNPIYEYVRKLRGNQPKIQYHYLTLRNNNNLSEYLKYYPEDIDKFNSFKNKIYEFTNNLYKNYIDCFIHKNKPLNNFPFEYKNHMFKLHEKYIYELRNLNNFVSKSVVINYINNLHPAQLMFSLNYSNRK